MTTLREQIESKFVRYDMPKCAVVVINGEDKQTVQKDDGTYGDVVFEEMLTLQRASTGTTLSYKLDPTEPKQKKVIDRIDDFINVKNPRYSQRLGLRKIGSERPEGRIENWDNMDIDQIEAVVRATNADLLHCFEYELHNPEGAREDVLEMLEEISKTGDTQRAEISEEVPAL